MSDIKRNNSISLELEHAGREEISLHLSQNEDCKKTQINRTFRNFENWTLQLRSMNIKSQLIRRSSTIPMNDQEPIEKKRGLAFTFRRFRQVSIVTCSVRFLALRKICQVLQHYSTSCQNGTTSNLGTYEYNCNNDRRIMVTFIHNSDHANLHQKI